MTEPTSNESIREGSRHWHLNPHASRKTRALLAVCTSECRRLQEQITELRQLLRLAHEGFEARTGRLGLQFSSFLLSTNCFMTT